MSSIELAEEKAKVNLLCRIHDIYISSPNCTQPNFAHTQGAMYLGPKEKIDEKTGTVLVPAARTMDRK